MTKMPLKLRKEIAADPTYRVCKLAGFPGHVCGGRITMEHAIIYAGRQVQEKWAIVSICAAGQEVDQYQDAHTMNKELNVWVALNQATQEELVKYPRAEVNWLFTRDRLNKEYGVWRFQGNKNLFPQHSFPEPKIDYSLIGL